MGPSLAESYEMIKQFIGIYNERLVLEDYFYHRVDGSTNKGV